MEGGRPDDGRDDGAKATELGGGVFLPAFDSPQGRLAGIVDPFGAMFSVINPTGVPQQ